MSDEQATRIQQLEAEAIDSAKACLAANRTIEALDRRIYEQAQTIRGLRNDVDRAEAGEAAARRSRDEAVRQRDQLRTVRASEAALPIATEEEIRADERTKTRAEIARWIGGFGDASIPHLGSLRALAAHVERGYYPQEAST